MLDAAVRTLSSASAHRASARQEHASPTSEGVTHGGTWIHDVMEENASFTDNRSATSDSEPSGALVHALTTALYTPQAA